MPHWARTQFVRLALIEGVVIVVGVALVSLFAVVAYFLDPQLFPTALSPR
jgi:hypothetical protein